MREKLPYYLKSKLNKKMKKILISLAIIGVVGIAVGLTTAYFSDTETSTGNTFTAGAIDLTIDNHCWYNGYECDGEYWVGTQEPCFCTWDLSDLDDHLFFDFDDLKPGDWGEDTVSLHVESNEAWACVGFDNLTDLEVDCTEPEDEAEGGEGCGEEGELAEELNFFFWADVCTDESPYPNARPGDNIYQEGCDHPLMGGPASDVLDGAVYTIADSNGSIIFDPSGAMTPLLPGITYYIGKAWCFGEMIIGWDGFPICDGHLVTNASQTDELTGDILFYAVQHRNNPNFTCESWWREIHPPVEP